MIEYLTIGALVVIMKSLDKIADDPDRLEEMLTEKDRESGGLAHNIGTIAGVEWTKVYGRPDNLP